MSYSNWPAFPVSLVGKYFLSGAGFWEACPRKCETRSSGLSMAFLSLLLFHIASLERWQRYNFFQFPAHQGRAKAAESHHPIRGCCEGQFSHVPEEHGNHLMKAICWCWAHLTQVWFQDCLEMTQWRAGRLVRTPERCLHRINHHPCSPGDRSRHIWGDLAQKWLCNASITSFWCHSQHLLATALPQWGAEVSESVRGVTKVWNLLVM